MKLTERGELLLSWAVSTGAIIGVFLAVWGAWVVGSWALGIQ